MSLRDLTDASKVVAAIEQCDALGPLEFRRKHGFGQARRYVIRYRGRIYDSKAIAGVAYNLQFPERDSLTSKDFVGGTRTVVRLLRDLGFQLERVDPKNTESSAVVFRDDEEAYLQWLQDHPDGLVLNVQRDPTPGYMPLHRTTCRTISKRQATMAIGAFTNDYIKVCALDHATLLEWIAEQGGETFTDYCSACDAPRTPSAPVDERTHWTQLQSAVDAASELNDAERQTNIDSAPDYPAFVLVARREFQRNPSVVAHVLRRARGVCECCKKPAPFRRRADGEPFLEVHHVVPLSEHGKDKPDNAVAVCPNCHRDLHFGFASMRS